MKQRGSSLRRNPKERRKRMAFPFKTKLEEIEEKRTDEFTEEKDQLLGSRVFTGR